MNDVDLINQRTPNSFFFKNKLYEYTQKTLSFEQRKYMKDIMESDRDSKKLVASVLMSLEYLEKMRSDVEVRVSPEVYIRRYKRKRYILHTVLGGVFAIVFSLTGISLLKMYLAGRL